MTQQIFRPTSGRQLNLGDQEKSLREIFQDYLRQHRLSPDAAVACGGDEKLITRVYSQEYRLSYNIPAVLERQSKRINMNCSSYAIKQKRLSDFYFCTHMKTYDENFQMDPNFVSPDILSSNAEIRL